MLSGSANRGFEYRRPDDLFVWIGCRLIDSWVTERRSAPSRHLALTRRRSAPGIPHRHRGSAAERSPEPKFIAEIASGNDPRVAPARKDAGKRRPSRRPDQFFFTGATPGVTIQPARCNRLRRLLRCRSGHGIQIAGIGLVGTPPPTVFGTVGPLVGVTLAIALSAQYRTRGPRHLRRRCRCVRSYRTRSTIRCPRRRACALPPPNVCVRRDSLRRVSAALAKGRTVSREQ